MDACSTLGGLDGKGTYYCMKNKIIVSDLTSYSGADNDLTQNDVRDRRQ